MSGLTQQMRDCLTSIEEMTVGGVPPSYEELREAMGLASKQRVFSLITALEERGYVRRTRGAHRSVEIVRHLSDSDLKSKLTVELLHMRARIEAELVSRS